MNTVLDFIHAHQAAITTGGAVMMMLFALVWILAVFAMSNRLRLHAALVQMHTNDLREELRHGREVATEMRATIDRAVALWGITETAPDKADTLN